MEQSIVRKKLLEYLEETKMSKYKFAQRSGISLSTIYDIIEKKIMISVKVISLRYAMECR